MELGHKTITELTEELAQIPFFEDLEPAQLIQRVPFLSDLPGDRLRRLADEVTLLTYGTGETVCVQGEYTYSFYIILTGEVEVSIQTTDDPHFRIATLPKNAFFGELSPLTDCTRTATITTLTPSILLEIPKDVFLSLYNEYDFIHDRIDAVYKQRTLQTHLRRVALFRPLTDDQVAQLMDAVELTEYDKGEVIFRQGEPGDALYIVRSGFVKISVGEGASEKVVNYLQEGAHFGEMALVSGETRSATVSAMTQVRAVKLSESVFRGLLESIPGLRAQIDQAIAAREESTRQILADDKKAKAMKFAVESGVAQADKFLAMDLTLCIHCDNCVTACAMAHGGHTRLERSGIRYESILLPTSCLHCANPECLLCEHDGIVRDKDGNVYFTEKCINCGACARRCPYGNILLSREGDRQETSLWAALMNKINPPDNPKARRVDKCDLCYDRRAMACVQNCPTGAAHVMTAETFLEAVGEVD